MTKMFRQGEVKGEVRVAKKGASIQLEHDEEHCQFEVVPTPGGFALLNEGRVFDVTVGHEKDESFELFVNGQPIPVDWLDDRKYQGNGGAQGADVGREIRAVMPGRVVRIQVKVGEELKAGDSVLVLEAMKMENEIKAAVPGIVKEILSEVGKSVEAGGLLIRVEPLEEAAA